MTSGNESVSTSEEAGSRSVGGGENCGLLISCSSLYNSTASGVICEGSSFSISVSEISGSSEVDDCAAPGHGKGYPEEEETDTPSVDDSAGLGKGDTRFSGEPSTSCVDNSAGLGKGDRGLRGVT
jgi:hypothetical protein